MKNIFPKTKFKFVLEKENSNMNSRSLLKVIGALTLQRNNLRLTHRGQFLQRLKQLYIIFTKLRKLEYSERKRRFWVRHIFLEDQRFLQGASSNLLDQMRLNDHEKYFNFLRMYPETFDELLLIIQPEILKQDSVRQAISPKMRLELTLRYLASGDSMVSLSYLFRVGKSTVSEIIATTCDAIWNTLKSKVFMEPTESYWKQIADDFNEIWNFKNCVGAIDGKHIVIQAPPNSGSSNYNYKGTHSINLLAIADAKNKFIMVDIGAEGRKSDSGVFRSSVMGQGFEQKRFHIPDPDNDGLPYVLVADEAFPLTEFMMRPYPRRENLDFRKKIFNYRLSRARRIVEGSFGIFSSMWRIFRKPIIASDSTVRKIVQACACLHNFLLLKKETRSQGSNTREGLQNPTDVGTSQVEGLLDIHRCGSNMHTQNASFLREKFTDYFCTAGAVEWQWQKALENDF